MACNSKRLVLGGLDGGSPFPVARTEVRETSLESGFVVAVTSRVILSTVAFAVDFGQSNKRMIPVV